MSDAFLSIRGIAKSYGTVTAVQDVSLEVASGEFVTFLGPSGSGKSTTLYAVAGFLEPTRGDVLLCGESLLRKPPNKRDIGMVFQSYTLFPHLNVFENVAFPLRVRRQPADRIKAKVDEMLGLVRLGEMHDRMPAMMSGGQQQRVALARALAYDPPILLMDEPLSALDKMLRQEIQTEIKRIHRETGVTILYVTHDQEEALNLSDRVALFNKGRIEQIGTGRDLYERPASRFVAGFIGDSNFLDAEVGLCSDRGAEIIFPDGRRMSCATGAGAATNDKVEVMVRPDHLVVRSGGLAPDDFGLTGTLTDMIFLGDHMRLTVVTPWGAPLSVRLASGAFGASGLSTGIPVSLTCSPDHLQIF